MFSSRRRFLQTGTALAGVAAAGMATVRPSAGRAVPEGGNLDRLAKALNGRLLRPGDSGYAVAAWPNASRWADVRPRAVALCTGPGDVQACVAWLQEQRGHARDFAVRSGGHNYAGFSTTEGLLIDVKPMNGIKVDLDAGVARVGAGASNQDMADALRATGHAVPSGRCPTVGTSGLVLGGGWGFSATRHGLTCDSLRETDVVTADGILRRIGDGMERGRDLFWAARGGGNFGVHTAFTFELYEVDDVTVFNIVWPAARQVEVLLALQAIQNENPTTLSTRTKVAPSQVGRPGRSDLRVQTFGQFWGSPARLREAMKAATDIVEPSIVEINGMNYWSARDDLVTDDPIGFCDLRSRYVQGHLSGEAIETMLDHMTRWPGGSVRQDNMGILFAVGGKVKSREPGDTAYVHRRANYIFEMETTWGPLDTPAVVERQQDWLAEYFAAMEPHVAQQSYVNFPSRDLADWQKAYCGGNLERLSQVKAHYDPGQLFRFPQNILLPEPLKVPTKMSAAESRAPQEGKGANH